MKQTSYIHNLIVSVVLFVLILCGQVILPAFSNAYFAKAVSEYSNVVDDLSRDETFNVENYPELETLPESSSEMLKVLQVAEGDSGQLYVYVYAPYQTEYAEHVMMSLTKDTDYRRYDLELCNVAGALEKYVVKGFKASNYPKRFYHISSISCQYNGWLNDDEGSIIMGEVSSIVDNCWMVSGSGNNVVYKTNEVQESIYIPASDMLCGHIKYTLDAPWDILINSSYNQKSCNSNFIAFKTDIAIDKINSAGVVYDLIKTTQETSNVTGQTEKRQTTTENVATELTVEDTVKLEDLSHYYTWKRIQSVDEFIDSEELTPEAQEAISELQWVLRFTETEYTQNQDLLGYSIISEYVENVQIFKLEYMRDGDVYNVGVISDIVSPDNQPENDVEKTEEKGIKNKDRKKSFVVVAILTIAVLLLLLLTWLKKPRTNVTVKLDDTQQHKTKKR